MGPNGSGKSSVLYALDWFFNGGSLSDDDFHSTATSPAGDGDCSEIDVEVTFTDLTGEDRRGLGQYGRGDVATFRRIWSRSDGNEKMIGNSLQGPGFAAVRAAGPVADMRTLYKDLRTRLSGLADVTPREDILTQLTAWENQAENADSLEEVEAGDASHMFGFTGEHVLASRIRMILVPASTDIAGQMSTSGKLSAVSRLIGALMAEAVSSARAKWEADNADQLTQLSSSIKANVEASTQTQAARVNELLGTLVPEATIDFVPDVPSWSPKADASVQTYVAIDGERKDVSRQGHGVQRAVMISMLQALVPDELAAHAAIGDPDAAGAERRLLEELAKLPALVVCVEEPEIFQHPVRARHFARVLSQWAERPHSQVLFATHSPYFILPEQFRSLRRFTLSGGCSDVASTSVAAVAAAAGVDETRVTRVVGKEIPTTFSEGFFADAVVFVEGDTDRVVLETLAERLGKPLDASGIAVLAVGGKEGLKIPFAILRLVGIPAFVVADADSQAATRKHPGDAEKKAAAEASNRKATEALLEWLPTDVVRLEGALPFNWGDPTIVTDRWCLFHDNLETELELWPEFSVALREQGESLGSKNAGAYRSAALDADLGGLPPILKRLVATVSTLGS